MNSHGKHLAVSEQSSYLLLLLFVPFLYRHLGTLMRCCEAWKPAENIFDPISLECVVFQRLSQIIANFTSETLEEREADVTNFPWTQTQYSA